LTHLIRVGDLRVPYEAQRQALRPLHERLDVLSDLTQQPLLGVDQSREHRHPSRQRLAGGRAERLDEREREHPCRPRIRHPAEPIRLAAQWNLMAP
jgi:hypothetical protein